MSDEEKNAQQIAEGDALENSGNETVDTEAEAPAVTQESAAQPESVDSSADKIINLSQKELADRCTKYKEIGKRQARREFENQRQSQPTTYGQPAQALQSPGPDYVFDPVFNDWVSKDMTDEQKFQVLTMAAQNPQQYQAAVQQSHGGIPAQQNQVAQNTSTANDPLKTRAVTQLEECMVTHDDFEMLASTYLNDDMVYAAASMPGNGNEELYQLIKENPHELYKIKNLPSSDDRKFRIRDLLRERSNAPKKVVTDVEAPPDSLESSRVSKDESELSYLEKKHRAAAKHWGR